MASEAAVQRTTWLGLARRAIARCTLFRSNSGKAILGGKPQFLPNGNVVVPFGRPIALGLALTTGDTVPGLSDLTGWTDIEITNDMVGRHVPVFTAIETKESGGGRKKSNQINFIHQVQAAGGIAGFAASEAEAHEIIDGWLRQDVRTLL